MLTGKELTDRSKRAEALSCLGRDITIRLAQGGMIKTIVRSNPNGWSLHSKQWTPIYVDARPLPSIDPNLYRRQVPDAFQLILRELDVLDVNGKPRPQHKLLGLATAGIDMAHAVTFSTGMPALKTRPLPKSVDGIGRVDAQPNAHGDKPLIIGRIDDGDIITVFEDTVSHLDSVLIGVELLRREAARQGVRNLEVLHVVSLVDRECGGARRAMENGLTFNTVVPLLSRGLDWLESGGALLPQEIRISRMFLKDPARYQNRRAQQELLALVKEARRTSGDALLAST